MVADNSQPNFSDFREDQHGGHVAQVNTLDWNCTGDCLGTGSADPSLLLYKLHPTGLIQTSSLANDKVPYSKKLPGVAHSNFFLIWHPSDPDRLVSLDEEGIRFWDTRSAKITTSLPVAKKLLYAVWTPNGNEVVVTTSSNVNMIVDVRKEAIAKILSNNVEVNQAAISPDGRSVLQGLGNGHIAVCDYPSFQNRTSLAGHMERVLSCKFDPSGRYFLSGSHDSTVTVWDFDTLMPVKNHYNYDSAINDASFSHDSQYLALGGDEYTIKINHTITGELAHKITCSGLPLALSWNPKHMLLGYSGESLPPDRENKSGMAYVNVFAPKL